MNPAGHLRRPPTDRATYTVAFLFEDRDMPKKYDMYDLSQILEEMRAYNPKADEYGGKHIIPGWADRIEVALNRMNAGTCQRCNGTGMEDSGGVQPWGEPILIECQCCGGNQS